MHNDPMEGMSLTHRAVIGQLRDSLGHETAETVLHRTQAEIAKTLERVDDRGSRLVRAHAEAWIAPIAATYTILREELGDQALALDLTFRLMRAKPTNRAMALRMLRWIPGRFALFRLAHRRALAKEFRVPGWDCRFVEDSPRRLAYTMRSCCYKEIFNELGVPEVAPLSCRMDDEDYALLPEIGFERPRLLTDGGDCCEFNHYAKRASG